MFLVQYILALPLSFRGDVSSFWARMYEYTLISFLAVFIIWFIMPLFISHKGESL
jgi:hypothetical protein